MPHAAGPKPRHSRVQFEPKLLTVLREGYGLADLRADMIAGLTVAIVALPLSMAIAIASGVGPERGLFTAIIGGFLVSALGGSRFQIGGPAGAFIVLVSACVADIGVDGLILATFLSGFLLLGMGLLRLGSYIKFIPYPVTVGFTAGIGVIIFSSQIKDLLGLHLTGSEPGPILEKLATLWQARDTLTPAALSVAVATVVLILGLRAVRPRWPGMLIAVVIVSAAAVLIGLPVETIYSRFGDLPRLPPWPALPVLSLATVGAALPYALSFTLLGAIESLLSAVVADGMSGHRHRPNAELLAQGVANSAAAIFGGFCVTGTIARTATNVRAGSRGPLSGMFHAIFVLAFLLIAAPLAGYIPLAALAGVLALVAWNMIDRAEIAVHQGLDLDFDLVRQLVAVRPEQLDAVVVERVVRGRDHHPEIGAQGPGQHGDRRGRHRPDQDDVHPHGDEARGERGFEHVARQAGVLADDDGMAVIAAGEDAPRRHADAERDLRRHRIGVGRSADAVGAEEFASHAGALCPYCLFPATGGCL